MKALFRLLYEAIKLPDDDGRMRALRRYADAAFGPGHTVVVHSISNDRWAWARGFDSHGVAVSLDARAGEGVSSTAALASALQAIAEMRKAQAAKPRPAPVPAAEAP